MARETDWFGFQMKANGRNKYEIIGDQKKIKRNRRQPSNTTRKTMAIAKFKKRKKTNWKLKQHLRGNQKKTNAKSKVNQRSGIKGNQSTDHQR